LIIALGFFKSSLGRESSSSLEALSSLVMYLGEEGALDFTFFLHYFSMRHVCFKRFGKTDLLDEAFSLMAIVAKSSLSDSELSSLEFHS
jgi:hypothetical protein